MLKHNNLMLRSEQRERLEAWAASVHISHIGASRDERGPVKFHGAQVSGDKVAGDKVSRRNNQLTRFQVWPPQNMPPKAQPCTLSVVLLFSAIVES